MTKNTDRLIKCPTPASCGVKYGHKPKNVSKCGGIQGVTAAVVANQIKRERSIRREHKAKAMATNFTAASIERFSAGDIYYNLSQGKACPPDLLDTLMDKVLEEGSFSQQVSVCQKMFGFRSDDVAENIIDARDIDSGKHFVLVLTETASTNDVMEMLSNEMDSEDFKQIEK